MTLTKFYFDKLKSNQRHLQRERFSCYLREKRMLHLDSDPILNTSFMRKLQKYTIMLVRNAHFKHVPPFGIHKKKWKSLCKIITYHYPNQCYNPNSQQKAKQKIEPESIHTTLHREFDN